MEQNANITFFFLGWKWAFKEMSQLKRAFFRSSFRPRSVSPRPLCSDIGRTWQEKELDQKLVKKHQFKAQVRVRPELAFPWRLLLASSHLQDGLHSLWGSGQHKDVRSRVQKLLRILRQWEHGVKPRALRHGAGLTAVKLALPPSLPSSKHIPGTFWDRAPAEERLFPSLSYL